MTNQQTAILMGDPPARHLAYSDVTSRMERELREQAARVAKERDGLPVSPYDRARVLWNRGDSLGDICEATGLTLARVYEVIREDCG